MFNKMRNRAEGESGFTLIELLVVILIIGILAAIAIPSFLNQRTKGQDACAKSMLRTMQTAMETYFTDYNEYEGASLTALNQIENQIPTGAACGGDAAQTPTVGAAGAAACANAALADGSTSYCVGMTSTSTRPFALHRATNGAITRVCGVGAGGTANTPTGNGGGCPNGTW